MKQKAARRTTSRTPKRAPTLKAQRARKSRGRTTKALRSRTSIEPETPAPLKPTQPSRRKVEAGGGLTWRAASPQHRTAAVSGGAYMLVSHDRVVWSAEWRSATGRAERLCFREPQAVAEAACERHRTLIAANALLVAADAAYLTGADVTGAATAWKRGRR